MNTLKDEIIVLDIAGTSARIACENQSSVSKLVTLGFVHEGDQMVRPILDDADRKNLITTLIELNALFQSGRDWSPAELLELYSDQGTILNSYRVITWKNPSWYLISNH